MIRGAISILSPLLSLFSLLQLSLSLLEHPLFRLQRLLSLLHCAFSLLQLPLPIMQLLL
jgi:hypothetical protein